MLKINDVIEINIESLCFGGEGLGKHAGMAVFVADSAIGDLLKVEITQIKKNYAKGKILEIITPSKDRVKPFCALANVCGGCQWQHIDYKSQLEAKRQIVKDNLIKIGKTEIEIKEVIPSPEIKNFRCKIQYPTRQTKVSKRFLAGYYKKGTHEVVNIKHCPIQPSVIDEINEFIKTRAQEIEFTAYNERNNKGLFRHFIYRYSQSKNEILIIFVINDKKITPRLVDFAKEIKNKFSNIVGVLANFNVRKNNIILGDKFELLCGQDYITEELEGCKYKISAGSFFQVNPKSAVNIMNTVKKMIEDRTENPTILDAYSGVGSFSIWLKDIASKIVAIEEYPQAVSDAKENIKFNNAQNIELLEGEAQLIMDQLVKEDKKFDVSIIDPPRKGCSPEIIDLLANLTEKNIIYVSCNPSTLARDLLLLKEKGFIPEYAQPVDMFCHTYHIESIVVLKKRND